MAERDHGKALDELRAHMVSLVRTAFRTGHVLLMLGIDGGHGVYTSSWHDEATRVRSRIAQIRALDALLSVAECSFCHQDNVCRAAFVDACRECWSTWRRDRARKGKDPGPWHKLPLCKREVPA